VLVTWSGDACYAVQLGYYNHAAADIQPDLCLKAGTALSAAGVQNGIQGLDSLRNQQQHDGETSTTSLKIIKVKLVLKYPIELRKAFSFQWAPFDVCAGSAGVGAKAPFIAADQTKRH
jgi:hypothetical protein